eukprot:TRINITY_DN5720_c0_g1_i1.p1 TRINITY_DN5720_c0_g1~~TRINITY_DN5720_c0_g1_i1.p1  ORF type:complete len:222 (+),score=38.65 TRINITY_DN5720_c0_g1_i1:54-719(+)
MAPMKETKEAEHLEAENALEQQQQEQQQRYSRVVGLEVFSDGLPPILAGKKTCSVRNYPLPKDLEGKPLLVLAIPPPTGEGHVDTLPDKVTCESGMFECVGVIVFSSGSYRYDTRAAFEDDAHRHGMVPGTSLYAKYAGEGNGWPGPEGYVYRWDIEAVKPWSPELEMATRMPALSRRCNSLFYVEGTGWESLMQAVIFGTSHRGTKRPLEIRPAASSSQE